MLNNSHHSPFDIMNSIICLFYTENQRSPFQFHRLCRILCHYSLILFLGHRFIIGMAPPHSPMPCGPTIPSNPNIVERSGNVGIFTSFGTFIYDSLPPLIELSFLCPRKNIRTHKRIRFLTDTS